MTTFNSHKFDSELTEFLHDTYIMEGFSETVYAAENYVDCYDAIEAEIEEDVEIHGVFHNICVTNYYIVHTDNDGFVTLHFSSNDKEEFERECENIQEQNLYEEEEN